MMPTETAQLPIDVTILGELTPAFREILTPDAIRFVAGLHRTFNPRREELLARRNARQKELDQGTKPDFLAETASVRQDAAWTIAPLPSDLQDRRVEITGPSSDPKMVINALNSGAKLFMADFEDANSPTWHNTVQGQLNLRDAIRRTLTYSSPEGKRYELKARVATLLVRPRGWHLMEKNMLVDGQPVSGSLFDFGLYFYHNAHALLKQGSGPYFYLPKIESHLESRLWNDVFVAAQDALVINQGTIKATVLIETIMAVFEMDEILYELREHSAGLNCGRWDYIFSYIKRLRKHPDVILPDRALVTMTVPFMNAYTLLTIRTCHRRNAPAIGGMAAQIPQRHDPQANREALDKVRLDKEREAQNGHDGTWVAHPGLVPVALEVFDKYMPTPNQIDNKRADVNVTAADLVAVPEGPITEAGLRTNVNVGLQYIEAWLRGVGAAAINGLMEDAATAEISRAQVWQWIRHPQGVLDDGRKVTVALFDEVLREELNAVKELVGEPAYRRGKYEEASRLFAELVQQDEFTEFLTVPGYEWLD